MNPQHERNGWFFGRAKPCQQVPLPHRTPGPRRLILLGPPGVGKGTQAQLLGQAYRVCHLATGDLFRAAQCQSSPSPALQAALDAMRRGELVPDDVVVDMVRERTDCLRCAGGFLLDGFPRTVAQAAALDEMLDELQVRLDAVLCFELPLETIVERLAGRRTCCGCKAVYHLEARPPAQDGVCDQCGAELIQRDDDRPESIRVRMDAYQASTQPLREYYEQRGKLITVSAAGSPEEIFERTRLLLAENTQASALA